MTDDAIQFLESECARLAGKIAFLQCEADRENFRRWVEAWTAPQPGERVQRSRGSEHAERIADYMIEFDRERERRVSFLETELSRIKSVLNGEAPYLGSFRTLAWARENTPKTPRKRAPFDEGVRMPS